MRDMAYAAAGLLTRSWRQSRGRTLVAVVLMLASGATMPLAGLSLRYLFDAAVAGRAADAVVAGTAVAVLVVGALTLAHFAHIAYFEVSELNQLRYDEELIALANGSAGLDVHENPEHADRLTVLDEDVRRTRESLEALLNGFALGVGLLFTGALLAALHPVLLLLPALAVPPLLATRRAERGVDRARTAAAESTRAALGLFRLATGAGPAKELRVFGLGAETRRRHDRLWRRSTATLWRAHRRAAGLRALGQLVFAAGYVAGVLLVVREAIAGRRSVGDVVLVTVLAAGVNAQVAQAVALLPQVQRLTAVDRRLRELGAAAAPPGEASAPAPDRLDDAITVDGVTFTYPGTDRPALRDVNLRLPAGSTVAIVGENGAGKTSLVKLLCGFYRPTAGHVRVDGVDLAAVPLDDWRARLAVGFQDFVRYELMARQAVGVGDLPREASEPAVSAALERANAADVVSRLPEGLDTQLGKSYADGVELSGGQWQKLALGRALMRERPLLLILDEPTAALDAETEHALFERYAAQARVVAGAVGAVTLLVSHRFSTVRMADLIVVVDDGRVVESGDHATLMRAGGLYAELYTLQASAYR
jgi:ATP-binding cassette, subfamily B, bacterial